MITPEKPLLHNFDTSSVQTKNNWPLVAGVIVAAVILGILTGYGGSFFGNGMSLADKNGTQEKEGASEDSVTSAGILDKKTFKDQAEGKLQEGGFEGEGSFHLERKGGESQNVYLTSSTVDLSQFIDKNVRVWGATFSAQKAGWLMDVGYIEVIK